jgi:hypothetical protein
MYHAILREDLVLGFRAALIGKIIYTPQVLVRARLGGVSNRDDPTWVIRYHQHTLNAYAQMLLDLAAYLADSPQEIQRTRRLASLIQRYYNFQLIRIGRQFALHELSMGDHLYAFQDDGARKRAIIHIVKRFSKLLSSIGLSTKQI